MLLESTLLLPRARLHTFSIFFGCILLRSARTVGSLRRGTLHSVEASSGTDVALERSAEGWWVGQVSIGGSSYGLAVDTGSSNLWVRQGASKDAPKGANATDQAAAAVESGRYFAAHYGRGSVEGRISDEAVNPGQGVSAGLNWASPFDDTSSADPATSDTCAVGRVTEEDDFWARQKTIGGVMGLGCSMGAVASTLDCLLPTSTNKEQKVFAIQLQGDGTGTLSLGYVPEAYRASLVEMPAGSGTEQWTVPLQAIAASASTSRSSQNYLSAPTEAIVDSGSDGVVGPAAVIETLAATFGAAAAAPDAAHKVSFYSVPCSNKDSMGTLEFTLGAGDSAAKVRLHGEDLVGAPADSGPGQQLCHLRLVGWDTSSWILGAAFIERLTAVVFYPDRKQVAVSLQS
eukprot:gnl/TRDRNA2_/TRDRNA2_188136_c0_seq1.p1 gnl/TRDRNA2_/TRDRNA2_188136_c0~~gnl/TRDRNA2_/TRDRNA2_188136_c0_seq1.p1  ORF type:complete len:402 (-),score=51.61 gnl/TRDRNA2_/TRDRNA2_188136_c0_seq1:46-1251(-)